MSIYLKINGITGSVSTKSYEKAIEIFNYHLQANRSINNHIGVIQNRTAGVLNYHSLMMTKAMDKASTSLLQNFYQAKTIPTMAFHHVTTGSTPTCYQINTFYDVLISGYEEIHDEKGTMEEFALTFSKHEKRIIPLDQNHRSSTPQTIAYDLQKAAVV